MLLQRCVKLTLVLFVLYEHLNDLGPFMRVKKQTLHFPRTRHILVKVFCKKIPKYVLAKSFVYASCGCVICFMCTSFFCPYVAKKRLFLMEVSWLYSITSCNKSDNMTFITQTTTAGDPKHTKNWLKSFLKEHSLRTSQPRTFQPQASHPHTFQP